MSKDRIEPVGPREGHGPMAIQPLVRKPREREADPREQRRKPKQQGIPQPPDPGEGHLDIRA